MGPKKRRQQNNKENADENGTKTKYDPLSIQTIMNEHLRQFESNFDQVYQHHEKRIEEKLSIVQREFEKYIQTHESQGKLARLLDKELTRLHHEQQTNGTIAAPCQELMDKTADLMNASLSETSRTRTYLIGELQQLPLDHVRK